MIADTIGPKYFALGVSGTHGAGETAQFITQQTEQGRRRLLNSFWLELGGVFNRVAEVANDRGYANWDGLGAEAISDSVRDIAISFLEAMPLDMEAPSVVGEPDGQIAFEWYRSLSQTMTVSVDPTGRLHYAALLGPDRHHGTEMFFEEIPDTIASLINKVTS